MKLLLASQSPRRRQLLGELGYPVEFISLGVDEHVPAGTPAADTAELLACRKASACPAEMIGDDTILVTADTVVVHKGSVPDSQRYARLRCLMCLRAGLVCKRSSSPLPSGSLA